MKNLGANLKNMFFNRNAITILGVLAGVVVLWLVYNATLNKAIKPQRVPVSTKELLAGTEITSDVIEYVEVTSDFVKKHNIITSSGSLMQHYVNNGTSIPKGGMFYKSQVVDKENLVERDIELIPEGYTLYWLAVDNTTTYANSIYPGDKIDLWLRVNRIAETDNKIVYEEFITSIDVLAVLDASGQNVFDVSSGRTPKWLEFAVPTDYFTLLSKIEKLGGFQLFPVPKNKAYTTEGAETKIVNDQLVALIESKSAQYANE